jgi:hypothetical protein
MVRAGSAGRNIREKALASCLESNSLRFQAILSIAGRKMRKIAEMTKQEKTNGFHRRRKTGFD